MMKEAATVLVFTSLMSCAPAPGPVFVGDCPDPESRRVLSAGSTYRDLALSRAEAIEGWRSCHAVVSVNRPGS